MAIVPIKIPVPLPLICEAVTRKNLPTLGEWQRFYEAPPDVTIRRGELGDGAIVDLVRLPNSGFDLVYYILKPGSWTVALAAISWEFCYKHWPVSTHLPQMLVRANLAGDIRLLLHYPQLIQLVSLTNRDLGGLLTAVLESCIAGALKGEDLHAAKDMNQILECILSGF